ncbi:MAG: FHA domain-containing protein [Candidatus Sumerlaeota bacterium]|nr:FHA domain-containing protein [Candidatus Sumerlaeota bacterium]
MSRLFVIQQDRRECIDIGLELTIGRSYSNRLRLEGADVSRAHAIIYRRADEFILRDLDSKNGVIINGQRMPKRTLQPGDVIAISHYTMIFDPPDSQNLPERQPTEPALDTQKTSAVSDTQIRKRHQRFALSVFEKSFTESQTAPSPTPLPHAGTALRFAYGLVTRLEGVEGMEAIAKAALNWAAEVFITHRGAVILGDKGGRTTRVLAAFDLIKEGEVQAHPKVLQWLFESGEALISVEASAAAKPERLAGVDHANRMAMPLTILGDTIGFIYLENDPPAPPFTIEELQRLYCVSLLVSHRMEAEKLKTEINTAQDATLRKI